MAHFYRSHIRSFPNIAVLAILFISFGCTQQKSGTETDISIGDGSGSSVVFPHPDQWESAASHGVWFVENDPGDDCYACHDIDSAGEEEAPACSSCHPLYPHTSDWIKKESHGASVLSEGKDNCATQCHGTDLKGGLSGIICEVCHTAYPHSNTWYDPIEHGPIARGNGKAYCKVCHGSDFQGGNSGISCNQCHANYPHEDDWDKATKHGVYVLNRGKMACGTQCHGTDFQGGLSETACYNCHQDYPHSDNNWVDGVNSVHMTTFIQRIFDGGSPCTECHGTDYSRELNGQSCTTCHPDGVTHTAGWAEGTGHGTFFSARYLSADINSGNVNCSDCHGEAVAFTDTTVTDASCVDCHPSFDDIEIQTGQTKEVLASQSDCYDCHWAYPHISYSFDNDNGPVDAPWGPADHSSLVFHGLEEDESMFGHQYYLMRSPLFTDSDNNRPLVVDAAAVAHNCGGLTSGSCHNSGFRTKTERDSRCGDYCHQINP